MAVLSAAGAKVLILGDFNLNEEMKHRADYLHKTYYDDLIKT